MCPFKTFEKKQNIFPSGCSYFTTLYSTIHIIRSVSTLHWRVKIEKMQFQKIIRSTKKLSCCAGFPTKCTLPPSRQNQNICINIILQKSSRRSYEHFKGYISTLSKSGKYVAKCQAWSKKIQTENLLSVC